MNGAESLIRTAVGAGVEVCFANPGTTEMPLVAALDAVPGIRAVLCLFEGVCTGAADGYARMADKPAFTLLHLGPGFANGIANLHNARRARSPVVNVIGDHATWHVAADAPLTSDIVSLARPVSGWIRSVTSPKSLAQDTADAIAAAGGAPGQVATLIVPANCQWDPADGIALPIAPQTARRVAPEAVRRAAELLRKSSKPTLFIGGMALRERGLVAASRVCAKTGARLLCETFPARVERGAGLPAAERLPYFPEQAIEMLNPYDAIVLAGAKAPVAFFGYPNMPGNLIPEGRKIEVLAEPTDDVAASLEALADEVGAPRDGGVGAQLARPAKPTGALNPATAGAAIAAL
ncbi:MAG: acetolactate synthase large subunit, partial [Candidatus Binataceae bacterium]